MQILCSGALVLNWYEWFEFSSDPFITTPLRSEDEFNTLFVKTESIKNEMEYLTSQIKSGSFLSLVAGSRGVGKSTTLQYASYLCQKDGILSFYIGLVPYGLDKSREPTFELTRILLYSIIEKLIIGIYTYKNDFFQKYKRNFIRWGKLVGLKFDEIEGFYLSPSYRLDFKILNATLDSLLKFIGQEGSPILICIDNLDKIDPNILIPFLRGGTSQAIFELMNAAGVSILIAFDIRLLEVVEKNPDLNYLKRKILLKSLRALEAESLISLRVQKFSSKPANVFYEKKCILYLSDDEQGITRNILNKVRELFIEAYNRKIKFLTYDFLLSRKKDLDEREIYDDIIQDKQVKNGSVKLLNLSYFLSDEESDVVVKTLDKLYEGKRVRIDSNIMALLMKNGILLSNSRFKPKLDLDIQRLFNSVIKHNWKIVDFIKWNYQVESIETVRIQYSGRKVLSYINKLLELLNNIVYKKSNIVVIENGNRINFKMYVWINDLNNRLNNILDNYAKLKNVDLEDVDTSYLNRLIYFIQKDFLIFFIKYYSIYLKDPLQFKNKSVRLFDWDYVFSGIRHYQSNIKYKFITYKLITNFLIKYDNTQKNIFQLSYMEIEELLFNLEQIIIEFSKQIEYFMYMSNMKESVTVDVKHIKVIQDTIIKLNKYFNTENYNIIISVNNVLDHNKEKLKENGLSMIINNSAINIRKIVLKEKNNRLRGLYNISIMVGINNVLTEDDVYTIMEIIFVIINYLEDIEEKEFLKPHYEVWLITYKNYDKLVIPLLNMIKKPIRTDIHLKTINNINTLFLAKNITLEDSITKDRLSKHVFIAYKNNNILSKNTAIKVVDYLKIRKIPTWYYPTNVKWADSITKKEEEAIRNAFAAIICYTPDFLEGKTSTQEYNALMAKKREEPNFKVGLLLINCDKKDVPTLMKDSYYVKISNPNDPTFESIMNSIYHSIYEL